MGMVIAFALMTGFCLVLVALPRLDDIFTLPI